MGAYLVAFQPGPPDILQRRLDVGVGQIADVGGAYGVVGRPVERLLGLRQQVEAGEEEGHRRVVLLGQVEESREEAVADLARAVPGEDHELRRRLARFEPNGRLRLVRLFPGVGRGTVTYEPGVLGGGRGRRTALVPGVATLPRGGKTRRGVAAARDPHRCRGPDSGSEQTPSTDIPHTVPIRTRSCSDPDNFYKPQYMGCIGERGGSSDCHIFTQYDIPSTHSPQSATALTRGPKGVAAIPGGAALRPRTPCSRPSPAWPPPGDVRARDRGPAPSSPPRRSGRPGR